MTNENKNQPPVKKFSTGLLNIAVWKNKTNGTEEESAKTFFSVTLERSYKDKDDNWQTTTQLRKQDLLPTAHLLNQAYDYLLGIDKEETDAK